MNTQNQSLVVSEKKIESSLEYAIFLFAAQTKTRSRSLDSITLNHKTINCKTVQTDITKQMLILHQSGEILAL